ncbi:MAG: acetyl-CoA carboxylase, carboxyltransferase subunit beta [Bacteroidota bacterium]|nr:acetyl-CoA carboxylase, carboxyltransferase subunit beta [Candidatus Kapabacteria bacterium]MCS7302915.1 acetyl-CoA carboxylase, carboxyltransferase subunit beta [Candidatus Kapabacteria bacterium]MCX7937459.1 acetyl-CoA carboxylase, carboxyltransferase subunit beta [Chlorobiota bacterium]MDW8075091.1 acetyl-CoA carboxylase, carboxyltransferase subunit beta [Bacteroidota bacterium]MDW8272020.1 acetyl-CoA carboxylase, carboxyltransferase subunit beta [Bacteroidota bacterium]
MPWFKRTTKNIQETSPREMPDGLWTKCERCGEIIYKKQLEEHAYTCPKCSYHFRIGVAQYVKLLFNEGTFVETDTHIRSADPLEFVDTKPYKDRLREAYHRFGPSDALAIGYGSIGEHRVSFGCMNFSFIGGSMGSVVGEKFVRAVRRSLEEQIPLVVISASGGARMQEAAFSLMQMAKTSAALTELAAARIPYISVLTDPTTGGVSASYAMLGDIIIAEPGALIGFAGPRVIEQTIRKKLPEGFQSAEFQLEHGFVDIIAHRKDLRRTIIQVLNLLS